jgi:tRNA (mo5U34)-methyltransferase
MSVAGEEPSIERRIADARWYHTIELPGGRLTRGEYDLRPILDRLPIPKRLDGARCVDIGSRDGFYAFEMERRGAEVVSVDLDDPAQIHFPGAPFDSELVRRELETGNRAFSLAREALDSNVERRHVSVYDLDPAELGRFDFGVIGTLLLHLRDPVTALAAVRRVIGGRLLLNESVIPALRPSLRRRAIAEPLMSGGPFWWLCNPAGLRHLLRAAGFEVLRTGRPYVIPYGGEHRRASLSSALRSPLIDIPRRLIERRGVLHCWLLATPETNEEPAVRA